MPTENRSSNTEMVSELLPCPFCGQQDFLIERLDSDASVVICQGLTGPHEACLARGPVGVAQDEGEEQPGRDKAVELWNARAEQHQGEPVAYLCKAEGAKWLQYGSRVGDPWKPGEVQVTPLYTHAGPGEVERLRDELEIVKNNDLKWRGLREQEAEIENLRTQVAERDALLREVEPTWRSGTLSDVTGLCIRIDAALSASAEPSAPKYPRVEIVRAHKHTCASCKEGEGFGPCDCGAIVDGVAVKVEPSAPVERDERVAFEAAWSARIERLRIRERGNEFYRVQPNDLYRWNNVQDAWELWQARAALERQP